MTTETLPVSFDDPTNAQILSVSEDQIQGFVDDPFLAIAQQSGLPIQVVLERIKAMMQAGTIRRVRQTLMANKLAPGALVAWEISQEDLNPGFDYLFQKDPFSGHVVVRTTDNQTAGHTYRLWTTLKVPSGYSMKKHCDFLAKKIKATTYRTMPANKLFALGVGHIRRKKLAPGMRTEAPARVLDTVCVDLTEQEWQVTVAIKRELTPDEIKVGLWQDRAEQIGMDVETFCKIGRSLNQRNVIGRFSTFLEHVKKHTDGKQVTRYNALYHWAVPKGMEMRAGNEVGRHMCMTHAYWREGGPEFNNVNIMGVSHGTDKDLVLAHKKAIDDHLQQAGIPVSYTNVFWGGRSEIKPSEVSPFAYAKWCESQGIDPQDMKD